MTLHKPWAMQAVVADPDVTYTAQEVRMSMSAAARIRSNQVLTQADFQVTQRGAGANFSVDVAAGMAGVVGDDIASQGLYTCWNDATVNVATPSAPASGTRIHRLVLQVRDKQSNGTWTTYDAVLSVLQDTGGGTPAEPNTALTLALITIATGQASVTNANIQAMAPPAQYSFVSPLQAFVSTSDVNMNGLSGIPVVAGTYRLAADLIFQQGGGTPAFTAKIKGPAITSMGVMAVYSQENAGDSPVYTHQNALSTGIVSLTYAAARYFFLRLAGSITFSAPGQFALTGNTSTGGTMTLQAGSAMDLELL
jgi:hypothetical protein